MTTYPFCSHRLTHTEHPPPSDYEIRAGSIVRTGREVMFGQRVTHSAAMKCTLCAPDLIDADGNLLTSCRIERHPRRWKSSAACIWPALWRRGPQAALVFDRRKGRQMPRCASDCLYPDNQLATNEMATPVKTSLVTRGLVDGRLPYRAGGQQLRNRKRWTDKYHAGQVGPTRPAPFSSSIARAVLPFSQKGRLPKLKVKSTY
jgi:hypothetical protein